MLSVHGHHKAYYGRGEVGWRWYVGGGGEGDYIPIAALTARMTPALRWAATRAVLMFRLLWRTKSQDSVHKPQPFWRERRAEAESSRGPSAYQPNALPLGQTGSPRLKVNQEIWKGESKRGGGGMGGVCVWRGRGGGGRRELRDLHSLSIISQDQKI